MVATDYIKHLSKALKVCREWTEADKCAESGMIYVGSEDYKADFLQVWRMVEAIDQNDVLAELANLNKNHIRRMCVPLFPCAIDHQHLNGHDSTLYLQKVVTLKNQFLCAVLKVCHFYNMDDLFYISADSGCLVKTEADRYGFNDRVNLTKLYDWCVTEGLIDGKLYEYPDFLNLIRKADFSAMYVQKKAKHKVCAIIRALYDRNVMADRENWKVAAAASINQDIRKYVDKCGAEYYKYGKSLIKPT